MASVNKESTSTTLYSYTKIFGTPPSSFATKFELPKLTVYDQKKTLMCVGYGIATALEILYGKQFSPSWGYGKYRDKTHKGQGLYFMRAVDYLCKLGGVPLSDFGVIEEVPKILDLVNNHPELLKIAAKYKPSGYCSLKYADDNLKDRCIKDALSRYKEGVAVVATSSKHFGAGVTHCIAIVGWNDETNSYIFQNSEGIDYGNNGRGEIPKEKIGDICAIFTKPITLPFKDVTIDDWAYNDILKMYFSGIVNGVSEDMFNPDGYITRREMCVMLSRYATKSDEQAARNIQLQYEAGD